jgi:hypothetical protein
VRFVEFDSFRAELRTLREAVANVRGKTVRDESLRERFRTLTRGWISNAAPSIKQHVGENRDFYKLTGEVEKIGRLPSRIRKVAEYRKALRIAADLADRLVLRLPADAPPFSNAASNLFVPGIPDVPVRLVPNAIMGWRGQIEAFLSQHPFDRSVFIMIRYRKRNEELIETIKDVLSGRDLFGVLASDHRLTDDLYNPTACLLCCARGIAVFDRAEKGQVFNPNVAYELGMLHLLNRPFLILKHHKLRTLQSDILMKLYEPYRSLRDVAALVADWA